MISGVILAAGRSARLGRPKQLLPLAGRPLLDHVLHNAATSNLDEIILVLGHDAPRIAAALPNRGQRLVLNPDHAAGQSSSLRAGLAAVDPAASGALFLLGDQPEVGPDVIDALIAAHAAAGGRIIRPRYGGRPGNPVLFARSLFPALARITGDNGARSVIRAHRSSVVHVDIGAAPPPRDVDTEEDYRALLAAWPDQHP